MKVIILQSGDLLKVFSSYEKAKEFMRTRCAFRNEDIEDWGGTNDYGTYYSLTEREVDE